MEIVFLAAALVPALALLLAPRRWVKPLAGIAAGLFLLCVLWTVSFAHSCSSDGCIGAFILGALTAMVGLTSAAAGAIRWVMITRSGPNDHPDT